MKSVAKVEAGLLDQGQQLVETKSEDESLMEDQHITTDELEQQAA